jgi:uncharacterized protein YjbI with pentapeptide repeats
LTGANLAGAELSDADLDNANMSGADLAGADVVNASNDGTRWATTTCPDGVDSTEAAGTCDNDGEWVLIQ